MMSVPGPGPAGSPGDGAPATSAHLYYPEGVAVTSAGTVYIGDSNNYRIRQFTVGGNIATVAGNSSPTLENLLKKTAPPGPVLHDPHGNFAAPSQNLPFSPTPNIPF